MYLEENSHGYNGDSSDLVVSNPQIYYYRSAIWFEQLQFLSTLKFFMRAELHPPLSVRDILPTHRSVY